MQQLRRFSLSNRLRFILIFSFVGFLIITFFALHQLESALLNEKKQQTKHLVESAHSILVNYHKLASQGKMQLDEAKKAALNSVKALRYDETNYFWINDYHPKMIMHPVKPKLNGKDLTDIKDPNGKNLFVAFADVVKKHGEGSVPYMWPKPGSDKPIKKLSYVKGFEPWGWVIGSGIYIEDVDETFWASASRFIIIVTIILILSVLLTSLISRSICSPIKLTRKALHDIAEGEGDLTRRLGTEGNDEIARLSGDFNLFVEKIQQTMSKVSSASDQLTEASKDLTDITREGSKSMAKQHQETEQVATAVTEMAATVQEIARSADVAASSANDAEKEAQNGMQEMQLSTQAIKGLAEEVEHAVSVINQVAQDSEAIGSVLDVIRGIAEQTNLLALNAAIEAARAGEQGRGFAVVADEVRTLASRTQESTQEIQTMIERLQNGSHEAVKVMDNGSKTTNTTMDTANKAAESLQNIVSSINTISEMNTQIASAAEQQSAVAVAIDESVNQISSISEQTVEGSDKVAKSSKGLSLLGQEMHELITRFKI